MSYLSDPDRLERLAHYVMHDPMDVTPLDLAETLIDAAERIRSHQEAQREQRAELLRLAADEMIKREGEKVSYSKCTACGHVDDGVCGLMYGHRCDKCGAADAAVIRHRKRKAAS